MALAEVPDEWLGLMDLVGVDIPDRPGCEALPSGSALTLKSDTSYLKALYWTVLEFGWKIKLILSLVLKLLNKSLMKSW